jgi:hypothetical protein
MNEEAVISKKLIMALVTLLPLLCCKYQLILNILWFLFQCHIILLSSNLLVYFFKFIRHFICFLLLLPSTVITYIYTLIYLFIKSSMRCSNGDETAGSGF